MSNHSAEIRGQLESIPKFAVRNRVRDRVDQPLWVPLVDEARSITSMEVAFYATQQIEEPPQ